jgi:hypothetical protein
MTTVMYVHTDILNIYGIWGLDVCRAGVAAIVDCSTKVLRDPAKEINFQVPRIHKNNFIDPMFS